MKRLLIFLLIISSSAILSGQKEIDYLMKGKALIDAGKPDEAVKTYTEALAKSDQSSFYLGRAEAFILKGDYSQAISDFNSANKLETASGEYGLARIYSLKGDASTAVYHIESNLKSTFRKSEKGILLDPSFSTIENTPEWRQFWKKDWYGRSETGMSEIEYYVSTGNTGEAKSVLLQLSGQYPGDDRVIYSGALISFAEGKYPETLKSVTTLLNSDPENEKYLRLLAKAQEAGGNQAGASATYSRLLDLGIPDAGLLMLRAECYRKTGETDKALKDINRYLELYPGNIKAVSLAGRVESASGDNIRALEYFTENLKNHPNDPQCYIDRANSYFISKSWKWAVQDYSMSLDLQPGNPDVWLNKGIALLNSGDVSDACHDFRKAFSLGSKKATELISKNCLR